MMMREEHDIVYFLYEARIGVFFSLTVFKIRILRHNTVRGVHTLLHARTFIYLHSRKRRQNVQSARAENDDAIAFFFYFLLFFFFSASVRRREASTGFPE